MADAVRRAWGDGRGRVGALLLLAFVLIALAAPHVAPDPVAQQDVVATRFHPPLSTDAYGQFHLLGTDRLGRDVWSRLAHGARISLGVGFLAMAISTLLGMAIGGAAGVFPRRLGPLLMGATDFALALPRVVLVLLLAALWQPSAALVIVVLGLTGWMPIARLVHAETTALMARPFVEGAFGLGSTRLRVLVTHILPNTLTPVLTAATLGVGSAISLEAGLSFLGLGVQPPTPSWGAMIASGRDTIVNAPWVGAAPGVALVLVVVGLTLLSDAVRDGEQYAVSGKRGPPPTPVVAGSGPLTAYRLLLTHEGGHLHLHDRLRREELVDADRGPGGVRLLHVPVLHLDEGVDVVPHADVVGRHLDDVREARACGFEHTLQPLEHLLELPLGIRITGNHPTQVQHIADAHRGRVVILLVRALPAIGDDPFLGGGNGGAAQHDGGDEDGAAGNGRHGHLRRWGRPASCDGCAGLSTGRRACGFAQRSAAPVAR